MRNNPKFNYYDGAGQLRPADELPELKNGKAKSIIEYLNRSGVLMEGNGALEVGMGSYRVVVKGKACLQIMTQLPYRTVSLITYETVEVRELVNETMSVLKDWVGEAHISKKLLGQTVLMKLIYPEFDKNVFAHVLKHKLDAARFVDVIEIGEGVFDEELALAGELPEFLRDALKNMNSDTPGEPA